jgi:Ca2+-binding EF-hand superfamily protein
MKLTVIALLLGLSGIASADDYSGPPGGYGDPTVQTEAPPPTELVGNRQNVPPAVRAQRRAERQQLRQELLARFDRNGDGRLEPGERRQAVRALRKMARKLAREGRGMKRAARMMRKYDLNHDGVIDQGEMPPAVGAKLRKFDRNHDGWVEPGEMPR